MGIVKAEVMKQQDERTLRETAREFNIKIDEINDLNIADEVIWEIQKQAEIIKELEKTKLIFDSLDLEIANLLNKIKSEREQDIEQLKMECV